MTSAGGKLDHPLLAGQGTEIELEYRARLAVLEGELAAVRSELAGKSETAIALAGTLEHAQARVVALETELRAALSTVALANATASDYHAKLQAVTLQCQTQAALLRQRLIATARLHRELLAANLTQRHLEPEVPRILRSKFWRLIAAIRSSSAKLYRRVVSARRWNRSVDS